MVGEKAEIVAGTLERGEEKKWEKSPVALLYGGSMLRSERNLT